MFQVCKWPYRLQVWLDDTNVRVKLIMPVDCRGMVERTVAGCEELLAQVSMREKRVKASVLHLMQHFKSRGWQVVAC